MGRTKRYMTVDQKQACRDFMHGLWSDSGRRAMFSGTLSTLWDEYKREPRYHELVRRLSEALSKS